MTTTPDKKRAQDAHALAPIKKRFVRDRELISSYVTINTLLALSLSNTTLGTIASFPEHTRSLHGTDIQKSASGLKKVG